MSSFSGTKRLRKEASQISGSLLFQPFHMGVTRTKEFMHFQTETLLTYTCHRTIIVMTHIPNKEMVFIIFKHILLG